MVDRGVGSCQIGDHIKLVDGGGVLWMVIVSGRVAIKWIEWLTEGGESSK